MRRGIINAGLRVRIKLEQGVEYQELDAGALKDFWPRDARENLIHYSLRPFVPVANRIFKQFTLSVEQAVINTPAINPETANRPLKLARPLTRSAQAQLY